MFVRWSVIFALIAAFGLSAAQAGAQVTPVGHWIGSASAVAVSGNRAYVGSGRQIMAIDVSTPSDPTLLGASEVLPDNVQGIDVSGDYVYVADGSGGLRVIDFSDPSSPASIYSYSMVNFVRSVAVSGSRAYMADEWELSVFDITDPRAISRIGSSCVGGDCLYEIALSGDRAYIANGWQGLQILSLSDDQLTGIETLDVGGCASGVALSGDYAFLAVGYSGMAIACIQGPPFSTWIPHWGGEYTVAVAANDKYACMADTGQGLVVADISSDPQSPVYVGGCQTSGYSLDVAIKGNYIFIADAVGLRILRVGAAPAPTITGITPNQAPAAGSVEITDLSGADFETGATVKLTRTGESDISATSVSVSVSTRITCSFNLTDKAQGQWNVVVTNPDGQSGVLIDGFTISQNAVPVTHSVSLSPKMAAPGDKINVTVEATGVTTVTANDVPLEPVGDGWTGEITANQQIGEHPVLVLAEDGLGNSVTDDSQTYVTAPVVGINNRDLKERLMSAAAENFLFAVWGVVAKLDENTLDLDDGSGLPVRVNAPEHGLSSGDYGRARGVWSPGESKLECVKENVSLLNTTVN